MSQSTRATHVEVLDRVQTPVDACNFMYKREVNQMSLHDLFI